MGIFHWQLRNTPNLSCEMHIHSSLWQQQCCSSLSFLSFPFCTLVCLFVSIVVVAFFSSPLLDFSSFFVILWEAVCFLFQFFTATVIRIRVDVDISSPPSSIIKEAVSPIYFLCFFFCFCCLFEKCQRLHPTKNTNGVLIVLSNLSDVCF